MINYKEGLSGWLGLLRFAERDEVENSNGSMSVA